MEEGRTVSNSYKDTMNLPETDFPMRGNLPAREPERLAQWQEMDIYRHVLEKNADGKPFVPVSYTHLTLPTILLV